MVSHPTAMAEMDEMIEDHVTPNTPRPLRCSERTTTGSLPGRFQDFDMKREWLR